jgi:putative RNA 2'-phosphotransferase
MDPAIVQASKFLSLILRHKPAIIGLQLDAEGWADVSELINAACASGKRFDLDLLLRVVHENDKQRFAFSDDGQRIRANQGHSIEIDLGLTPIEPPSHLYHGTVDRFIESIERQGLLPQNRQYVHLSADFKTAKVVGSRRGKPIVLVIDSKQMHQDHRPFFRSSNGVWLTEHVPPQYLRKSDTSDD